MSFFNLSTGETATGEAEKAHMSGSMVIPHNTRALAEIKSFKLISMPSGDEMFEVKWCLKDTKYKGVWLSQKLKVYDKKPPTADRAKEMMMRILRLGNFQVQHSGAPSDPELAKMEGRVMGLNILQWFYDGKEGNWVNEVHNAKGFESKEGEFLEPPANHGKEATPSQVESYDKFMQTTEAKSAFDDDIPF